MFKSFTAVVLIICCGFMGLFKAQKYSRRVKDLSSMRDMLRILDTEISYRKDPLFIIFNRVSSGRNDFAGSILSRCCFYMKQRLDMTECWSRAVDDVCGTSSLTAQDKAVICGIGEQIGRSDISGQNKVFLLAEEKLKHQIQDAVDEKNSKGKMYGGLGFTVGILITVLLI